MATITSVALTGIGLLYSIPTALVTATNCGSLRKIINTKIRNKIIKNSQMYISSKQFSDKFTKLYTKSMNDNKIDNDEYYKLVNLYEEYKKNKKFRLCFFKLKLIVFSNNNLFSNNNISINIYQGTGSTDR